MSDLHFSTASELAELIDSYFNKLDAKLPAKRKAAKSPKQPVTKTSKIRDHEPEPATITGLAEFLGFDSRQALHDYEAEGEFAEILKRGCLRIEAVYEKKLHQQSAAGAIFALKNRGWSGKSESKARGSEVVENLNIVVTLAGPELAGSEKEVVL